MPERESDMATGGSRFFADKDRDLRFRAAQASRRFLQKTLLAAALVFGAGAAAAQDIDWVVNVNDTGFDPIPAGGTIVYQLTVTNAGIDPAPATTVTLTIPATTTFTGGSGTITGCTPVPAAGPGTVVCNVPAIAPDGTATLGARIRTTSQGTVTFSAAVPTAGDTDPANNVGSQTTTVTSGADISLALSGPATAASGSTVSYTFTATNLGPDTATNLTLSFPAPTGLTGIVPPPGCTLTAGIYACLVPGPLALNGTAALVFSGQISVASGSTVSPVGSISGTTPPDPITSNNTASFNTSVSSGSDVSIAKSRAPAGAIKVGDPVTFTLAGAYTGDSPSGLTITDIIPANYAITAVTPAPGSGWVCTVTGRTVSCTRTSGSGPGTAVSLGSIAIATTAIAPGTPVNTATISAAGPADPNLSNNSANDGGVQILAPTVDLRANKSGPNPPLVVVGNSYSWQIDTTNLGNTGFFGTVLMTDNLPAGLTLTAYTQNGWTCSPAVPPALAGPVTITCQRDYTAGAPLDPGATTPPVLLQTTATGTGTILNSLTVTLPVSNLPDDDPSNNTISYGVTGSENAASADIRVLKTAALPTLAAGDVQTFRLEVVNSGPTASADVDLTDDFTDLVNSAVGAAGAGYIGETVVANSAGGVSCSSAPSGGVSRRLTCTLAAVPICTAGVDCAVITVQVRPGGDGGARNNTARAISRSVADPDLSNNAGTAAYTIDPRADVSVTKVASPSPAVAGQNLTYVITALDVGNGLSSADNVTIDDTLPADVTFVSASPSNGSCSIVPAAGSSTGPGNNRILCNLGTISNGGQRTVTVVVQPKFITRGTVLTNSVAVSTTTPEINPGNDNASVTTPVANPTLDLLANKSDSIDPVAVGQDTVYTLTVTNTGPSLAENVVLTDPLPATGLSFQSFTVSSGGTCTSVPAVGTVGGTMRCEWASLPAGQAHVVSVTVQGTAKGVVTNTVNVTSDEVLAGFDTNPGNNTDSETTTVRTRADVEVASKVPSANPVSLRDPFSFVVTVRNNTGPVLSEADNTTVTDNLPAGMVLTGTPTVAVTAGTATASVCTGTAGATSFTCDLGTFSSGAAARITVPVKVNTETTAGQVFTNTATISTSSLDVNPANNVNSGQVTVNASSISGTVFRDFAADGAITPGDTGIGGVTLTISGIASDGAAITGTVTTAADGSYTFGLLPEGTYTITRGAVSEANLNEGQATAGTSGGGVSGSTVIATIALPDATAATGYLFAKVPVARIGIAKQLVAPPAINADGSFNVTFRIRVENLSLEALNAIEVTDPLAGAAPRFGAPVTLGSPGSDPMVPGTYVMLGAPSGSCGGLQGGFNGSGGAVAATGFTLASRALCTIDISLRVQPTVPLPPVLGGGGRYANQATVTGNGALSGQTPGTNPQLTDLSQNGAVTDPNGNGIANEPGENTPTPVAPVYAPAITLLKSADVSGYSSPPAPGDVIRYAFAVRNAGNVTLTGITLTDSLPGIAIAGGPIASLAPGATDNTTFTATYTLIQADIDAGRVTNQATTTGTDPFGTVVSDLSGTGFDNNLPTATPVPQVAAIALQKTADASGLASPGAVGDPITYAFTVRNTGNVTLTGVTVTDPKLGVTLTGGPIASLAPGATDTTTFTASYRLVQADLDAAQVVNTATARGNPPTGPPVTDPSGSTLTTDDPTVVPIAQAPSIALVKTSSTASFSSPPTVGDRITYAFTVRNTGTVTLFGITLADALPGVVFTGGPIASLAPGGVNTTAFTASYALTQADLDAGQVTNSATVTGNPQVGPPVTDVSGSDAGNDTPTVTPITRAPAIALVKAADITGISVPATAGDPLRFRFTVTNTGNVTLTGITLSDALPGLTIAGGPIASLAPGVSDGTTFTATYPLTQADVDRGNVTNQATVTGRDPANQPVTDLSGTAQTNDNPTVTPLGPTPLITLVKTADTTGLSTPPKVGETIRYAFSIRNAGNVTLTGITLTDSLPGIVLSGGPIAVLAPGGVDATTFNAAYVLTQTDLDAGTVSNQAVATGTAPDASTVSDTSGTAEDNDLPTETPVGQDAAITLVKTADTGGLAVPPVPGNVIIYRYSVTNTGNVTLTGVTLADPLPGLVLTGGPIPSMASGVTDASTFTGTYVLTQADIDAGRITNQATVTGTPPSGPAVSDVSGTDAANDTPTVTPIAQTPALTLDKAVDDSGVADGAAVGDVLPYTFTVTNTGNVTLTNVTIADPLPGLALTGGPIPSLAPGAADSATFTATYTLVQADLDRGTVANTATAAGGYTDAGGAPQGVSAADTATATVFTVKALPETFPAFDTDGGTTTSMLGSDTAGPGAASLANVTITVLSADDGVTLNPATGLITLAPGKPSGSYTVTYRICSIPFPLICSEATETVVQRPIAKIEVTKTQAVTDNGDGVTGVGDTVTYTMTVENKGNVPLTDLILRDEFRTIAGTPLTLDRGPDFVSASQGSAAGALLIGETATYTASFVITIQAVNGGGLSNVAIGDGLPVYPPGIPGAPDRVTDRSDNGIDSDGNVIDDPTVLPIAPTIPVSGLTVTKTTPRGQVNRGDTVPYTITVKNENTTVAGTINIVDELPPLFLFVPGSTRLDGVAVTPIVQGRVVTVPNVAVPPLTSVVLTLSARIATGAQAGEHVNTATLRAPGSGAAVAPVGHRHGPHHPRTGIRLRRRHRQGVRRPQPRRLPERGRAGIAGGPRRGRGRHHHHHRPLRAVPCALRRPAAVAGHELHPQGRYPHAADRLPHDHREPAHHAPDARQDVRDQLRCRDHAGRPHRPERPRAGDARRRGGTGPAFGRGAGRSAREDPAGAFQRAPDLSPHIGRRRGRPPPRRTGHAAGRRPHARPLAKDRAVQADDREDAGVSEMMGQAMTDPMTRPDARRRSRRAALLAATAAIGLCAAPAFAQSAGCDDPSVPLPPGCKRDNAGVTLRMPIGENTERVQSAPAGDLAADGFSISLDDPAATASPDTQRATDRALQSADLQIKFDGLGATPRLNVSTTDLRASYRGGDPVRFRASTNYPAYIARAEVLILDKDARGEPVVDRVTIRRKRRGRLADARRGQRPLRLCAAGL